MEAQNSRDVGLLSALPVIPWQVGAMAVLGTAKQFQMFSLGLGMDATAPTSDFRWSSMLERISCSCYSFYMSLLYL